MIQHFHGTAADVAGGLADAGRGKLALVPGERAAGPLGQMVCREAQAAPTGEQELLDYIVGVVQGSGLALSRALIVNYYVSLKTNPFVILTGAQGRGKTDLARLFAEALVGRASAQYTLIPSAGAWPGGTGEDLYYRSLHEQFSSWRFLDLLQEAALPSNRHKAFFVCFDALHPEELEYYFARLLQVDANGTKRLNLPGFPSERQLVIPPNVYITATVDTAEHKEALSRNVLRRAGIIEFRSPQPPSALGVAASGQPAVPPIGLQRIWLRTAVHDLPSARARLVAILGEDRYGRLHWSPKLGRLVWRTGLVLTKGILQELETYIANSFDRSGRGLFDANDVQHNAQIAYDSQVIQRFLWRLRDSSDEELRRDLAEYLDVVAFDTAHQAVA